ncbi:MAG TPA: hypothetical protein VGS79_27625 [Puia sp.]|nr:hypothetical protein [Puia sp.]
MMFPIEKILGVLAALIISCAQVIYLINTIRRRIQPSVLSWVGWSFLMGTSVVSQVLAKGWQWSMTSVLSSAVGCLTIGLVALFSRNYSLTRGDWKFLGLGALCIGIYVLSGNAWMTTIFAISADALLGIPTILKAIREPELERSPAWVLGVASSTLALVICFGHSWIYVLFPAYLFCFNGLMAWLTQLRPQRAA